MTERAEEDLAAREKRALSRRKKARRAGDTEAEERALQELLDIERVNEAETGTGS